MAKKETKEKKSTFLKAFNISEIARLTGIDYYRLHHVLNGNRPEGFTDEEKDSLSRAIAEETNKVLTQLGSPPRVSKV